MTRKQADKLRGAPAHEAGLRTSYPVCVTCRSRICEHITARITRISHRERQVISCLTRGLSNREIGEELSLSEQVIKQYLNRLFMKLKLKSRWEVGLWGLKNPALWAEPGTPEPVEPEPTPAPRPAPAVAAPATYPAPGSVRWAYQNVVIPKK